MNKQKFFLEKLLYSVIILSQRWGKMFTLVDIFQNLKSCKIVATEFQTTYCLLARSKKLLVAPKIFLYHLK